MTIKAVTFDLWKTIIIDTFELGTARGNYRIDQAFNLLRQIDSTITESQVADAYGKCIQDCDRIRDQEKDISFEKQVELFVNNVSPDIFSKLDQNVFDNVVRTYSDSIFKYPPPLHRDTKEVLDQLKFDGYTIGLISNTAMTPGVTFRRYMANMRILSYFDTLTFSDELGEAKPSRRIFQETLDKLRVQPNEAVHIGDHLTTDVFGASRIGMRTIWVQTHGVDSYLSPVQPDFIVTSLGQVPQAMNHLHDCP